MASNYTAISTKIPPPAQFALAFLVGIELDRVAPWRPAWMAIDGAHWVGLAFTIAGCALAAAATAKFVLKRTTLNPTGQPARLVMSGPHAWSRNPMYLALTIVSVGLALALGRAWPLVLTAAPWASMNWAMIPFEEARMCETSVRPMPTIAGAFGGGFDRR